MPWSYQTLVVLVHTHLMFEPQEVFVRTGVSELKLLYSPHQMSNLMNNPELASAYLVYKF